jgi:hypothetical protein
VGPWLNGDCPPSHGTCVFGHKGFEREVMMGRAWSRPTGIVVAATALGAAVVMAPAQGGTTTGISAKVASATNSGRKCPLPVFGPGKSYHPKIDRKGFSPHVTNPWFPLVVGRTLVYTGVKDGKRALNIVYTTPHTKRIDGVQTRVIEDRLYLDNVLEERTRDYYAQDRCGNVWYFGEDTAELDAHGKVTSTEGSFHAGVKGAQPGVFMQARPRIGRWFRQEWAAGHAEDRFKVLSLKSKITVPFGTFRNAMQSEERTDLEPGVVDNKYYVRGVGEVFEGAVKGPQEVLKLVEIIQ